MISSALRALTQIFQPELRAIFWKTLGYTLALLLLVWIALNGAVAWFVALPYPWLDTALSILTGIGVIFVLGFLVAPVTAIIAGLLQDDIAEVVERGDYPADPPGRALPMAQAVPQAIKFTGIVILGNLLALFLLLVPGVNLVAFLLVNGYLLGREFFEFAAMRFRSPEEAKAFRRAHRGTVFLAGLAIAGFLAIPLLNLLTPIFATVMMVHLNKRITAGNQTRSARAGRLGNQS
ncbi:sulfate transporter family protein [Stappia taiwanensis]|uniref:Sulfate transporter family protein n=1 Tax=Stappia taiwanensis TaxID=992267 RepID=A0A838Y254_9HYPH|nr:sulfate transporter family protein [Stappia taiwanensis]MBA4613010.1 sulfate transporter family protein [Stappia taiwanensis]GGF01956.1 cysteine biosynthesis protein [Stappia taiwanensis]